MVEWEALRMLNCEFLMLNKKKKNQFEAKNKHRLVQARFAFYRPRTFVFGTKRIASNFAFVLFRTKRNGL
jgi:hypothetical protein